MLICSYFKVFKNIFFITLYVQNCNFSQKVLQHFTKIKTEYIWSKSHVIKDEVLCRTFKTIMNGWLDGNADLKCKMFALSLFTIPTSHTLNT